jgi:hypothetical protein
MRYIGNNFHSLFGINPPLNCYIPCDPTVTSKLPTGTSEYGAAVDQSV